MSMNLNSTILAEKHFDISQLCEDPALELRHAWDSSVPDMGLCVERTLLVWIPCFFLWISAPVYIILLRRRRYDPIPWTSLAYMKIGMSLISSFSSGAELIWAASQKTESPPLLDILASVMLIMTHVLHLYLIHLGRRYAERSSPLIWIFWAAMLLFGIPQLFTSVYFTMYEPETSPAPVILTFLVQYLCSFVLFVVNSLIDAPSKTQQLDISKRRSPELDASFPNRLTFWWSFPIVYQGWKKPITEDDLWDVIPKHTIDFVSSSWKSFYSREKRSGSLSSKSNQNCKPPNNFSEGEESLQQKDVALYRVIWSITKFELGWACACKAMSVAAIFVTPQLLGPLIGFITDKEQPLWRGYFYAISLLLVCAINTLIKNKMLHLELNLTIKVRSALMAAVYEKALKLSTAARRDSTVGQIVNLMAVDAQTVGNVTLFISSMVASPATAFIALVLLWQKLGPSVLAGITFLVLMIPFNSFVANKASAIQAAAMKHKDKRVKMVSEIIGGIKVLKLYAWESYFVREVEAIRDQEIKLLKKAGYLQSFVSFIYQLIPNLIALITFTTFLLVSEDNVLTAETAFVSISLFNIMRFPVNLMAVLIDNCVQGNIALKRIQKFISSGELDPLAVRSDNSEDGNVVIQEGLFSWENADGESCWQLKDIELKVTHGQVVAIVGSVGAGKTSLISALLGEMTKEAGKVVVNGSVAYVPQQAWLQNSSLRDNITWGQAYEEKRYQEVVKACALQQDLDMLPDGDMTEIGERGINMSGGQKQRISLARAVYSDADIYLLDDPLSAVDAHVGRHIFDKVIGPEGLLKKKTRILVTHAVTYLPQVDYVVVMKDGCIVERGCYTDLVEAGGNFSQFVLQHIHASNENDIQNELKDFRNQLEEVPDGDVPQHVIEKHNPTSTADVNGTISTSKKERGVAFPHSRTSQVISESRKHLRNRNISESIIDELKDRDDDSQRIFQSYHSLYDTDALPEEIMPLQQISQSQDFSYRSSTNVTVNSGKAMPDTHKDTDRLKGKGRKLVEDEEYEIGKIDRHLYYIFAKAMGIMFVILPIILVTLSQVSVAGGNIWLSVWSSSATKASMTQANAVNINLTTVSGSNTSNSVSYSSNRSDSSPGDEIPFDRTIFLIGYGTFGLIQATFMYAGVLLVTIGCLQAANKLHKALMISVVHLPMSFFDTNPSGRIINRFSKEINVLDLILPGVMRGAVQYFTQVIVTMAVIVAATPIAAVFIIPIMAIYYFMQVLFVASYRQLKRIESISKSPVYTHFSETIQGASVIRAFKKQQFFISESLQRIERSQRVLYLGISVNRWLGVQLDILGNLITFAAAILAVAGRETISPGVVGMSVTYALYITVFLNWLVRISSDIEANIVSVERINEYLQKEPEADWRIEGKEPSQKWPEHGHVVFNNYQTQYRPGLDLVLKGISCSFKPAEKVGIVGRTGAGKSSLTLALFRLIEATKGDIIIDDVNISNIGLHDLRSQISIIPQDPVLFSGTVRLNLDPSGEHGDAAIWLALELSHLNDYIQSLPLGLQHVVDEEGSNFSVGQKQLVCLARALLRQSRVLVLDEATAAVDLETDDLIQATIRDQFKHCTVLTIAHRLNTIMDSDRVMVLDNGKVAEFEAPSVLLNRPDSIFYGLAKEAGLV